MPKKEKPTGSPSKRELIKTARMIGDYTEHLRRGGLAIRWSNLTEDEARRLVDLTKANNHSTRAWWPLVLRGAGVKQRSHRSPQ